jgi:hypothetical protein
MFNSATRDVTIAGTFTGLTGAATNAHLHGVVVPPATTAAPIFTLTFTAAAAGNISGTMTLTAAQAAGLLAGNTYLNVHTAANGGGEIRGNVGP